MMMRMNGLRSGALNEPCWVTAITSELQQRCQSKRTHGCRSWVNTAVYPWSKTTRFALHPVNNFCKFLTNRSTNVWSTFRFQQYMKKKHVSLISDYPGLSVFVNSTLHLKIGHLDFFAVSPCFFSCDWLLGSPMDKIRQDKVYGSHNEEVVALRKGQTVKDNKKKPQTNR